MTASQALPKRTPVAFYHIVSSTGKDMGWVGYCEAIDEAMIPTLLHPDRTDGAERRSLIDPPRIIAHYDGEPYAPYSWVRSALKAERDLFVVDAMKVAAENARSAAQGDSPAAHVVDTEIRGNQW